MSFYREVITKNPDLLPVLDMIRRVLMMVVWLEVIVSLYIDRAVCIYYTRCMYPLIIIPSLIHEAKTLLGRWIHID